MSDLNSHCPAIGTEIDIYLHSNRDISMTVSNFTLRSLIVGVYVHGTGQADWLLAWDTTNTPSAKYAFASYRFQVNPSQLQQSTFTKDVDQHHWYCWVNGNIEVATVHAKTPMVGAPSPFYGQLASLPATLPSTPVAKTLVELPNGGEISMFGEAPCPNPTCRKMNDIGIRKCWNCEGKL